MKRTAVSMGSAARLVARPLSAAEKRIVASGLKGFLAHYRASPKDAEALVKVSESKPGVIHGETDDFSYNIVKDGVHIRDFHATVLNLLGFDHERFSHRYLGLDQKLTGVEQAKVVNELIS